MAYFPETTLKGDHFMSRSNAHRMLSVLALTAALSLAPFSEAMAAPSRSPSGFKSKVGAGLTSLWHSVTSLNGLKGIIAYVGSRWDPNGLD